VSVALGVLPFEEHLPSRCPYGVATGRATSRRVGVDYGVFQPPA
jgi:hypothetical protein